MKEYCFVIQPYDGGDFDNRYDDIIKPALESCKKPIIPLQMEDLELNSGFKFYIGSSQIIAVPEIRRDAPYTDFFFQGI